MPKSSFVDFKAVKAAITMEQLLKHYDLLDRFKRSGDSLSGPCPIHKGENPTQFRVSISKNIWNCFSKCKHGGNTLDFIARMENITIHAAALHAIEWFNLDPASMSAESKVPEDRPTQTSKTETRSGEKESASPAQSSGPNKPLKFRLEKLEREHPYLATRGLSPDTITTFDIGYCIKGMMAERIAIPIRNSEGAVVAYAGRFPGEPEGDTAKYKLPPGFRKSLELFNLDRAIKEPADKPLIIVEGFFGCMKLHQHGCRKVVALMGSVLSGAQEDLLKKYTDRKSRIILMLDEDEAGRLGRENATVRLAKFAFMKVYTFANEGQQPENLTAEEVAALRS